MVKSNKNSNFARVNDVFPLKFGHMEGDLIRTNAWLAPISWIYGGVMFVRNYLFDCGILESESYDIPIISVGNITVGGTGKTPHIEYLVRLLSPLFKVAVLSRGYKRRSAGYVLAHTDTPMKMGGDGSWQIKQRGPEVYVAVDANRRRGIERLMNDEETKDVQVILLDDAFQHRYVVPGHNILLTDYHRLITQDEIMPMGRLRESAGGKERASIVIVSKCPRDISPMDFRIIASSLDLRPYQHLFLSTYKYGRMVNLHSLEMRNLKEMSNHHALLLTGIGCPKHLEMDMKQYFAQVKSIEFQDHHDFSNEEIAMAYSQLEQLPEPRLILTTEKDTTKLISMKGLSAKILSCIWVLPVGVQIMQEKEGLFNDKIIKYVQKNLRNR